MKRSYQVVDVFTHRPFRGNPVAVVLDADGLDEQEMQAVAGWTHLSETTFVLPPSTPMADYRLRIFTPRSELPFAGHPTLGSAHAVLATGRAAVRANGTLVQECAMGLIEVQTAPGRGESGLALRLPPATVTELTRADITALQQILSVEIELDAVPAIVDVGPAWIVARLASAAAVVDLRPDFAELARGPH